MKQEPMLSLSDVAAMTGGRLLGADFGIMRVVSDSRALQPGDLFVALTGERFDGHDFVDAALQLGAGALVDDRQAARFHRQLVVSVPDTLQALGALAKRWRQRLTLPVVAVVGSNGKTTIKEMIAATLRRYFGDDAVHATHGNFNNAIGVPLTLLGLRDRHQAAVIELGMNHRGETLALAAWTAPDVAVINNAQREHQEFMKSVEEVAEEHSDVLDALRPNGWAVLNADDAYSPAWYRKARGLERDVCRFGLHQEAEVRGVFTPDGKGTWIQAFIGTESVRFLLTLPGQAMAMNALAALAVTYKLGVPLNTVAAALSAFHAIAGRLHEMVLDNHWTLIDDTYNANPDSVRAAIDVLATRPGERWLILGDMAEVGDSGTAFHSEIGAYAKAHGVTRVLTLGVLTRQTQHAFGAGGEHFTEIERLLEALQKTLATAQHAGNSGTLLIKGSRFMQMERVVSGLQALRDEQFKKDWHHAAVAR